MSRKNLKVSEITHEEITIQKRRDESVDDFLRRELGIIPNSVDDLTTYYPDHLHEVASYLVQFFRDNERYFEFVTDHDDYFAFNFDAKESRRTIIQLCFKNNPPWVDIYYRNERGEMEHVGQVLQEAGEDYVVADVEFTRPDTGERLDHTNDFDVVEDELYNGLRALQNAAYERWG